MDSLDIVTLDIVAIWSMIKITFTQVIFENKEGSITLADRKPRPQHSEIPKENLEPSRHCTRKLGYKKCVAVVYMDSGELICATMFTQWAMKKRKLL